MRISLLGPAHWQTTGDAAVRPLAAVDAVLLYLLAATGPCDRGALAARLWPDSEARLAQANLRQRVFRLRRTLGPSAVTGTAMLALDAGLAVDVREAEAALAADPAAARGVLLDGIDWPDGEIAAWLEAERRAWRHRLSRRLAGLASEAMARGDAPAALPYAARLVDEWPDDDAAYHRLMQLHVMAGDLAAAHEVFRRCEATLLREDGRRPGAATRELARRIADALTAAGPAPAVGQAPPPGPARLVGRQREWQRLERAWRARRPLLVSGEPGTGKSRLIGDFATVHGALVVGARPGDAPRPYALAARLLEAIHGRCGAPEPDWVRRESARILPWLGACPAGPAYARRLQAAMLEWFRHARGAGLPGFVVDDLQYADEASLELLLEAAAAEGRAGWLFAVRAAEEPALLQQRVADAGSDAIELLPLEPLDAEGVAALLVGAGFAPAQAERLAPGLWRHTGGNPYFVLQTAAEAAPAAADMAAPSAWPVAPHLQALLTRRLERLSPAAQQLAQLAALAGTDFSAELAARLLDCTVLALGPAWLELERAQLLRGAAFAHDLGREAVLSQLPEAIALAVHRRLGETGAGLGMPAVRQAAHWRAAGDERRAATASAVAADEAGRLSRRHEEALRLDEALAGLQRLGETDFGWLERRVRAARYVDRQERQLELGQRLVDAARGADQRCRALAAWAGVLRTAHRLDAAQAAAQDAVALAARLRDPARTLAAVRELARVLMTRGREDEALQIALPHRDTALAAADTEAARFLVELAIVLCGAAGRPREAWPLLQAARRVARAAADWGLLAEAELNLGYVLHVRAQVGRAALYYRRARETHLRTGSAFSLNLKHFVGLPRLYRELGRYDAALALFEAIEAEQRQAADYRLATVARADLSFLWLQLGEPERAAEALGGSEPPSGDYLPAWLLGRARIALWRGAPAAALLQQAFDLVSDEARVLRWLAGRDLALSLPPAQGAELARRLLAECEQVDCDTARWPLRVALCERLHAAGRIDAAADLAEELLQGYRRHVLPSIYSPQAWLLIGRALAAAGRRQPARLAFERGRRWIREALPYVPPPWRDGFLHRNPYNAALLAEQAPPLGFEPGPVNADLTPSS